jgi:hypothetical protein
MGAVEGVVGLAELGLQEGEGSVEGELHDRNCCCFNELYISEAGVVVEELLQILKSHLDLLSLRDKLHSLKDRFVNCNVDIAVFNCNSVGTAAEQFYGDGVVLEQKLDALESYNATLVVFVGLFRNTI